MNSEVYTRSRTNLFLSYRASSSSSGSNSNYNNYNYDDENGGNGNGGSGGNESSRLMGNELNDETIIDMNSITSSLPPAWVDLADKVDDILSKVKPKSKLKKDFFQISSVKQEMVVDQFWVVFLVNQLDKLHSKHVLPGFNDRSLEEREINEMALDITRVSDSSLSSQSSFHFQPLILSPSSSFLTN